MPDHSHRRPCDASVRGPTRRVRNEPATPDRGARAFIATTILASPSSVIIACCSHPGSAGVES
eukprot:6187659-Pleurochrysis_carterae.AAC.5